MVGNVQHWVSVGFINLRLFEKVNQLETALLSRVVIEQAKGVLAGRHQIDLATAFDAIRSAARRNNLRLKDVCRRVIDEPETPELIVRQLQHLQIRKVESARNLADVGINLDGS
jgi:hypothetical protein